MSNGWLVALAAAASLAVTSVSAQDTVPGDPYVWLEDVDGPRALEWVRAENQRTLGIFEADPR